MDAFHAFAPLTKIDVAQRLVTGVMCLEVADHSREIMDYDSAKPEIEKWSNEARTASGGASLGNVREMHGKVAAGLLKSLTFDDDAKAVRVTAYIEDDQTWRKIMSKTLTGFSIGGGYARKWTDPSNKLLKRYTPRLSEVSVVDRPCQPGATIEMTKADGTVEMIEADGGFQPSNDDVKAAAEELAKAAGKPDRRNDFLAQAREDLISAHIEADEPLAKVDPDPAAELEAALSEAAALTKKAVDPKKPYGDVEYAAPGGKYPVDTPAHIRAAWSYINMPKNAAKVDDAEAVKAKIVAAWKKKIDPDGPPSAEKADLLGDLSKSWPLVLAMEEVALEKGFYTVGRVANSLAPLADIVMSVIWEEAMEQDSDSTLPQTGLNLLAAHRSFLIDMINEESAEFMDAAEKAGGDGIALLAPCIAPDVMEMAQKLGDLHKLDTGLMEKVGAKISNANMKHVQAMHDHSQAMGATCDSANCAEAEKMAKVEADAAEAARLRRVLAASVPQVQALTQLVKDTQSTMEKMASDHTAAIDALTADLEKIKKGPGLAKGVVGPFAVTKEDDDRGQRRSTTIEPERPLTLLEKSQRAQQDLAKRGVLNGGRAIRAPGDPLY